MPSYHRDSEAALYYVKLCNASVFERGNVVGHTLIALNVPFPRTALWCAHSESRVSLVFKVLHSPGVFQEPLA